MSHTTTPMEPLRTEHRHLLVQVEALREAADAVGAVSAAEQEASLEAAERFLTEGLIPHATAEDEVLYPEIDRLLGGRGTTRATDTMRRDHLEVVRLAGQVGRLHARLHDDAVEAAHELELRRVLYGLHAVVALHFAKEEEVYLPLLDRELTAAEADALFERLEAVGVRPVASPVDAPGLAIGGGRR